MKAAINHYIDALPWTPQPGPQTEAFWSEADLLLYGGAAGGGKTALAVGLACLAHRESLFIRRESKQLAAVVDYVAEVMGTREGWNSQEGIFRIPSWDGVSRQIVIGSTKNPGDETKYQGRPRDLLAIDEAANMLESAVSFLQGWVRSTVPGQRCRTILCSNPPTDANGYWLVEWFAPWLDSNHALYPYPPGKLLWYGTLDGKSTILPKQDGKPFEHNGEMVIPQSRTFIPARIQDNKYLRDSGYLGVLQALPEPLRSAMLYGDFESGREDASFQVIPSAWVDEAMARWEPREFDKSRITSMGVDPSRGGRDSTVIACREDWYFHPVQTFEGEDTDTGGKVAALVLETAVYSHCPVHVDSIGIGSSVTDHLDARIGSRCVPVNVASSAGNETDWGGNLQFINTRARLWWQFRDMLNPENGRSIALPKDQRLKAELCTPKYELMANGIKIESKKELIRRLGRSTDVADAVILAAEKTATFTASGNFRPAVNVTRSGDPRR